ncbi:helix-turn-helix transcriptional regulator [Glaesserella parasuis]|nr:helix-turn-helix transcriptional regulator [Glaesserella parasuis]MCT8556954.1 helix-turn-helix transcriptional regulator [Glaesserella parasuis]MCT8762908.1 helix-turn-helix transcriptional regulator [Glaesserella parasuis]MCT8776531.1 helix-turn-helix transcriptional regulator [Glaesserella parasuis]MCT8779886.1 helix-turn-helix transcriptional regulator [Glaesserella parasuis]
MSKPNIYDEKFSERMKMIAEKCFKSNYSEFSRAVGVAQASLARWVKGEADPSRSNLVKIAEVSNVNLLWLATGQGQRDDTSEETPASNTIQEKLKDNISMIISYEGINVSAGFGSFNEGTTEPDGEEPYSDELLARLGVKAHHCAVFWANGNSMSPTIENGDQMLVDLSKKEVKGNRIYLVQNGDSVWVKRVKIEWDGVELISDNKEEYRPIRISADEAQNLQIIGQVVHIGHNLI